ncbi:MAG: hypothetical protein U9N33_07115 [Campylobacterota bacterium]|nr:hypothetical protein [Campylobacterota bacterium]
MRRPIIDGNDLNKIYTDKLVSFDEQIEYLKQNKIKSFKITNQELINSYFELKEKLNRQLVIPSLVG